jgi:hypothetical protein
VNCELDKIVLSLLHRLSMKVCRIATSSSYVENLIVLPYIFLVDLGYVFDNYLVNFSLGQDSRAFPYSIHRILLRASELESIFEFHSFPACIMKDGSNAVDSALHSVVHDNGSISP